MIINHNISALNAHRMLKIENWSIEKTMEKLSSGLRINRAADDASGLAVSEKMRAQVRGLNRAAKNGEDMISLVQTTEGYLNSTQEILQRIRELAVQSSNGIYTQEDRDYIQVEVNQLVDEIDRIASHAQFNGFAILTGRFADAADPSASMWVHIGANVDQRERLYIGTMTAEALGVKNTIANTLISVSTPDFANMSIATADLALEKVSRQRADLGAYQNRLEYAIKGVLIGAENLQAAESRIRDTDMAAEVTNFVRDQILTQASTAMLGHANVKPQLVLSLLR